MTNFSDWPEWLKVLVLVPHGILGSVALVMVAELRKRVAQVRICGGVPIVLRGYALRLSNERFQVVDVHGPVHSKPLP